MPLNKPILDWQGKRVWLIGASTGIGAALAENITVQGGRVALSARSVERLQAQAERLPGSMALPLDISQSDCLLPALTRILATWGGVDVVIFNAGTYVPVRAWNLVRDAARATIETNLLGVMNGVATVVPQMLHQGQGHIVIVASVAGYRGLPNALTYGPTKAALNNFAEVLYIDLAPRGLGVSVVNPGFVETPLTAKNDFKMPAIISADEAARKILVGLSRGEFEIHFPKRFTRFVKLLRYLPYGLYFRLIHKSTGL